MTITFFKNKNKNKKEIAMEDFSFYETI